MRQYLCNYGNCQISLPSTETYLIGKPHGNGAPRFCSAGHAVLSLSKDIGEPGRTLLDVLRAVAGMIEPPDDGGHTRDDVLEKRAWARAVLKTLGEDA